MKWFELCIHTTNEAVEPIANILHECDASGVAIEDIQDFEAVRPDQFGEIYELKATDYPEEGVNIKAYFPEGNFTDAKIEEIKKEMAKLKEFGLELGTLDVTTKQVDEEDWAHAWKKYYKPVRVSKHITVSPSWETYTPEETERVIELDPGMAFGTGTHPTTVLCIQSLEKYIKQNDTVIDVGCGSGVLSIASILLGASHVDAFDLDEVAVTSANSNVKFNHMQDMVTVKQNDLLKNVNTQVDVIVSNILAEIIVKFVEDAHDNLKQNGLFITSGIISEKEDMVRIELEKHGFVLLEVNEMDGWVSLVAQKA